MPLICKRCVWGIYSGRGARLGKAASGGWVVGKVVSSQLAGKPRVRGGALASVSILSLVVMSVAAKAQPAGGSVVAGQAQISSSGAATLINQSSSKAIINWQSFSVGQGSTVQFNQPNASAITLNRVTGTTASAIDGAIRANGQVWLLNPNGILLGNGSTINVGGLLATTSDINDQDFLGGRYNFSSTGGKGSVSNAGSITTSNGGSVVLSAPNVVNKGIIQANTGHVVLGGTDTFTVDFQGDHLLSYAISPDSAGGKVLNSGKLAAAGGTILMTARAAQGVQDAVVNNTGIVEATSVHQENGEIILEADNGTVSNSGTLDASGKASGETGGTVKVLGQQVAVTDGAKIDVSGDAGGGTALIGGNLHGAGPEPNAQNTTVGKATINANAITFGNGGTIVINATGNTSVTATITAKGGITSGKGGMIETSGHMLDFAGASVNAGVGGQWLLDPFDLTVDSTAASTIDASLSVGTNVTLQTTASGASGPGNPNPAGNGDIIIDSALSWNTAATLTLDAYHSILINTPISITGAGGLALYVNDGGTGGIYSFGLGANVNYGATNNGGTLSISNNGGSTNAVSYNLIYNTGSLQSINSALTANYALATSLDASGVSGWTPIGVDGSGTVLNTGNGFVGAFEGLGNTVSNLTVSGLSHQGLFGFNGGSISNIGMVGGSVSGTMYIGGLVGYNAGPLRNSYSTAAVTGTGADIGGLAGFTSNAISASYATGTVNGTATGGQFNVGGLVGVTQGGAITQSFATGAVTVSGGYTQVGGLVGQNVSGGSIIQSYATGAVTAATGTTDVGGLVGWSSGTITDTYAMGAVNANGAGIGGLIGFLSAGNVSTSYSTGAVIAGTNASAIGGFVGQVEAGSIVSSYWDTETSGLSAGIGVGTPTSGTPNGAVTSDLQAGVPSGFNSAIWGTGTGLYPYLLFQGAPQVVTGTVEDASGNPVGSNLTNGTVTVSSFVNGSTSSSATVGANGVYYLLLPPNTINGSNQLLTYVNNSTSNSGVVANDYFQNIASNQFDAVLLKNRLLIETPVSSFASVESGLSTAIGGNSSSDLLFNGAFTVGTNLVVQSSSGSGLTIDTPINLGAGGTFTVEAFGPVAQTSGSTITASTLGVDTGGPGADITLTDSANHLGSAGFTTQSGNVVFSNAGQTGTTIITNANVQGDFTVNALNSAIRIGESQPVIATGIVSLSAGASISQGSFGLTANGLFASASNGSVTLTNPGNQINGGVSLEASQGAALFTQGAITLGETSITNGGLNIHSVGPLTIGGSVSVHTTGITDTVLLASESSISTSGGFITVASGVQSFTAMAHGTLSLDNPSNSIAAPITLHGQDIIFNNSVQTVLDDVSLDGSGPANSITIAVLGESNPGISIVGGVQATGPVSLHARGSILSGNEGNFILAGSLQLQSDTGQIGTGQALNVTADNLTAQTTNQDISLNIEGGFSSSTVTIGSGFNPGVGINAGSGNVTLNSIDTIWNQNSDAPIIANNFTINSNCSDLCGTSLNATLTAPGNQVSGPVSLKFGEGGFFSNVSFTDSSRLVLNPTTINGNLTLIASGAGNPGIILLGQTVADNGNTISLTADGDIGAVSTSTPPSSYLVANEVDLTSNFGSIGVLQPSDYAGIGGAVVQPLSLLASTLTAATGGGDISLNISRFGEGVNTLTIGNGAVGIDAGNGNVTLNATNNALVQAQGSPIIAQNLTINAGTSAPTSGVNIALNAPNTFNNITGTVSLVAPAGSVALTNSSSTTLGNGSAETNFSIVTPGDITIAPDASISAGLGDASGATSISLQAGGNFINNSGLSQNTLDLGNSTIFNIYSQAPASDAFGNLNSSNTAIWDTSYLTPITAAGDRYIFAFQPTLTVAVANQTKAYGTDDSAALQSLASTISGVQPGVAGAFLGDTAGAVYSGTPTITSVGSVAGASVGAYAINANLTVSDGYTLSSTGILTVTPQTLVYNAASASRTYGAVNPVFTSTLTGFTGTGFTGTVTGFVNGDSLTSATSGTLIFTSPATNASGVGIYAVNGSGLTATNYIFEQNSANATALTITPAILSYAANAVSLTVGAAIPAFSGTVTGFLNGDTRTSATMGTLVFSSSATSQSPIGSYAIDGSGLTAANYTFVQAPGNSIALMITAVPPPPPPPPPLPSSLPLALASFTNSIQPLVLPSGTLQLDLISFTAAPAPPPLPSQPPGDDPLADLSDSPNSSDQTTSEVASSLDGGSLGALSVVVIPSMLVTTPLPPPGPTDASELPSFGNSSLWQ